MVLQSWVDGSIVSVKLYKNVIWRCMEQVVGRHQGCAEIQIFGTALMMYTWCVLTGMVI